MNNQQLISIMQYETKNLICHQQISTFVYKNRDTVRNLMTLKRHMMSFACVPIG